MSDARRFWLLLVPTIVAVAAVCFPLTRTFFFADDFGHLLQIADRGFLNFFLRPFAGHLYHVRNIFFYGPYALFGFNPAPYAWLAFCTHLLNVALLFHLARNFTGNGVIGVLCALVWGTNPLQSGATGWFSAYGHVLAGTACLLAFTGATVGATVDRDGSTLSRRTAILCVAVLWLGAMSFGVGIATAFVAPIAIWLINPGAYADVKTRMMLFALPVLVLATYVLMPRLYAVAFGQLPLDSRLVSSVAFSKLAPIANMFGHLIHVGITGLLWSFSFIPEQDPAGTAWSTLAVYALLVVAAFAVANNRVRRRILALMLLASAAYGVIALGRANVLIDLYGLSPPVAASAPRYHYLATLPVALMLGLSIGELGRVARLPRALPAAVLGGWVLVATALFAKKGWWFDEHAACRESVRHALAKIDAQIDGEPAGSTVRISNEPALSCFSPGAEELKDIFAIAYPHNRVRGRHVQFVVDASYLRRLSAPEHRRFSTLLVALPTAAPAPETPTMSAETACSTLKQIYERNRASLKCTVDNWESWNANCKEFFPGQACAAEVVAALRCLDADPISNWSCGSDGTLELPRVTKTTCAAPMLDLLGCEP